MLNKQELLLDAEPPEYYDMFIHDIIMESSKIPRGIKKINDKWRAKGIDEDVTEYVEYAIKAGHATVVHGKYLKFTRKNINNYTEFDPASIRKNALILIIGAIIVYVIFMI